MSNKLLTRSDLLSAEETIKGNPLVVETPLIQFDHICKALWPSENPLPQLFLKLESMQTTGSFKIRGVVNQLDKMAKGSAGCVTMSAGNYGKSLAFATGKRNINCTVCLPSTAPKGRDLVLQSLGASVERVESSNLLNRVQTLSKEQGLTFLHPFDDFDLIAGHGTCGEEIVKQIGQQPEEGKEQPDFVLVCCGGGGLLSGIALSLKTNPLSKPSLKVIGVEPTGADKMYQSLKKGSPVTLDSINTIAAGLAPPFAGTKTFAHVEALVDSICLVSDQEILKAMKLLFDLGLKVEPSGCAAFAALMFGKVQVREDQRVVVVVTGGNVSPQELSMHLGDK